MWDKWVFNNYTGAFRCRDNIPYYKCDRDFEIWQNFQAIVNNCRWIASYQELCVVCDRPCILTFDEQHKLHGEDKAAIQFVDGYSVYACHGERLSKFN
ncbi:MAG: DUF6745 domain-containing protein [Cyanobacteria bacterium J06633_8]